MKTFYSIIKMAPNSLAGDTLSIGLVLFDGEKFWLHFSDDRKNVVKRLLDLKGDTVEFITKQIQQRIDELNTETKKSKSSLFELENILTSDKFTHISNYSNGVLRFSEPAILNDSIDEAKFMKLFTLLVDKNYLKIKPETDEKEIRFKAVIERKLIKRVANKVHTNLELTPEKLPGLFYNFNIDCIGLNGAFVAAKAISFNRTHETIDKELSHYLTLISVLNKSNYKKKKTGEDNFYVLSDEPSNVQSKEHRIWENLKSNLVANVLFSEEAEKVADKIEEKKASTFL
ncbi:MAG TPA: hypothetical protein VI461_07735 [Chitinophagaceae bacterium]|nr:hypothetical protein [Chitinophagaceae bacterium]